MCSGVESPYRNNARDCRKYAGVAVVIQSVNDSTARTTTFFSGAPVEPRGEQQTGQYLRDGLQQVCRRRVSLSIEMSGALSASGSACHGCPAQIADALRARNSVISVPACGRPSNVAAAREHYLHRGAMRMSRPITATACSVLAVRPDPCGLQQPPNMRLHAECRLCSRVLGGDFKYRVHFSHRHTSSL